MTKNTIILRQLGLQDYVPIWHAMQKLTDGRNEQTLDEIWILEHSPVFTQGQNGKPEHVLAPGNIPVIQVDRGGQVTYHGPGQLVAYTLIDLQRKKLNVRELVSILENSVIALLKDFGLTAIAKKEAPGIYINDKKICSVGLRIRKGCSFHGLAFNVAMDLEPFSRINPCGFKQLEMTQLTAFDPSITLSRIEVMLIDYLIKNLGYTHYTLKCEL